MSQRPAQEAQVRGNARFSIARLLGRGRSRAPIGIAGFIGIPLFFSALMASTLAQEKPHTIQWRDGTRLLTTWHDPTAGNVARIWLWAMVPSLVLLLIGVIATRLPLGFYIPCVAAVLIAMAVAHKTATWERHHTARFPWGVDLIPGTQAYAASNKFDPGQWEGMARQTSLSLQHWTISIALASAAVMALLWLRRTFFGRRPVLPPAPLEGIHGADATPPFL